jgi:opacity protein-like surface antigen
MLRNVLRGTVAALAVLLAAASASPQQQQPPPQQPYYGQQQQPYYGQQQQPYQGGYQQPYQGGYQQPQQGGYAQPANNGGQAGFGSGGTSAGNGGGSSDDVVGFSITLDPGKDGPVAQGFCQYAQKAGCTVQKSEQYTCVAQCQEGPVALIQEGPKVSFGCLHITEDQCKRLVGRILNTN